MRSIDLAFFERQRAEAEAASDNPFVERIITELLRRNDRHADWIDKEDVFGYMQLRALLRDAYNAGRDDVR